MFAKKEKTDQSDINAEEQVARQNQEAAESSLNGYFSGGAIDLAINNSLPGEIKFSQGAASYGAILPNPHLRSHLLNMNGLPAEVKQNISEAGVEAMDEELKVLQLLKMLGGHANMDELTLGLYNGFGVIIERVRLTRRLRSLERQKLVSRAPRKRSLWVLTAGGEINAKASTLQEAPGGYRDRGYCDNPIADEDCHESH